MHTKGPWQYDAYDAVIKSPTGVIVCRLTDLSGQTYARPLTAKKDGQLLAAAPDLLAACQNEVPQLANLAKMIDPELTEQLMEVIYAAIAAARGEEA